VTTLARLMARLSPRGGFRSEVEFWERELTLEGEFSEPIRNTLEPHRLEASFPGHLIPLIEELKFRFDEPLRALDVGSGPLSLLAHGGREGWFELCCADPLADEYKRLLDRYGHKGTASLTRCYGEEIVERFGEGSFHLVYSANALDHTQSPARVVEAMTRTLKPGGVLAIHVFTREGTFNHFHGLHQHDLFLGKGGELFCESRLWPLRRPGRRRSLTAGLGLEVLSYTEPTEEIKSPLALVCRKRG